MNFRNIEIRSFNRIHHGAENVSHKTRGFFGRIASYAQPSFERAARQFVSDVESVKSAAGGIADYAASNFDFSNFEIPIPSAFAYPDKNPEIVIPSSFIKEFGVYGLEGIAVGMGCISDMDNYFKETGLRTRSNPDFQQTVLGIFSRMNFFPKPGNYPKADIDNSRFAVNLMKLYWQAPDAWREVANQPNPAREVKKYLSEAA